MLAPLYAADPASADWRHLGRLAGFTNRKSQRCQRDGLAPWVKLIYARNCLAHDGAACIERAATELSACAPAWDSPSVANPLLEVPAASLVSPPWKLPRCEPYIARA